MASITNSIGLLIFVFCTFIGTYGTIKKHRPSIQFLIAYLVLIISVFLTLAYQAGIMPYWARFSMQAGSALEVTLLSLALADRINILKDARVNAEIKALKQEQKALYMAKQAKDNVEQERKRIRKGLHDSLGAELTDISLSLQNQTITQGPELQASIKRAIELLRIEFNQLDDLSEIEHDFIQGIQIYMLRRYSNASRKFKFATDNNLINLLKDTDQSSIKLDLFELIRECVTNDLKYGTNQANWQLNLQDNQIRIEHQTHTNIIDRKETQSQSKTGGNGTIHINEIANKLNATITRVQKNKSYTMIVSVPLKTLTIPKGTRKNKIFNPNMLTVVRRESSK